MPDPTGDRRARPVSARDAGGMAPAATLAQHRPSGKRLRVGAALALLVFAVAVSLYANTLQNAFVSDDRWIVAENPLIRDLRQIPRLFTVDYWHGYMPSNLYRPVTMATFAFNYALGGAHPAGYHAVNVMLHGLCAVFVLLLARRFWPSGAGAAVAGILFALHPVHSEAVDAVFGRSELLAAVGVLGALLLHARDYRSRRLPEAALRGIAVTSFGLAALSKESAFVLPALLVLYDVSTGRRPFSRLRDYIPYAAAAVVLLAARAVVLAGPRAPIVFADNPLGPAPISVRLLTATAILGRYIGLLFWPVRLSADYSYAAIMPISSGSAPGFLLGLLGTAAVAGLGIAAWRRSPGVAFAVFFFFVTIAPVANLFFPIGTIMAERLLYLPSVSICFLGAASASWLWRWGGALRRAVVPALAVIVFALLAARTVDRNRDWRTNRALFESALRVVPNSFRVHSVLGEILVEEGNDAEARTHFERAIQIWPKWADTYWKLGAIHRRGGDLTGAQPYFREALRRDGEHRGALFSLAETDQQLGHLDAAVEGYRKLEALDPCVPGLSQNLGYALRDLGRLDEAEAAFRGGLACSPDSAGLHRGLATVLEQRGDRRGAEEAYRQALARDPADAVSANNLAWMLAEQGRPSDEALELAERALRLQPDAIVYDTIAWIRFRRGDLRGAREAILEAARLDSTSAEIRDRRETIEAALKKARGREGGSS